MIKPIFDETFKPFILELRNFENDVAKSGKSQQVVVCVERKADENYVRTINCFEDGVDDARNCKIVERMIKAILWTAGGYKIYISGSKVIYDYIKTNYVKGGKREFDAEFMETVFEKKMEIVFVDNKEIPEFKQQLVSVGKDLSGRRIGLDVGGSDIKISAVKDGEMIFAEEIVWLPKLQTEVSYHYEYFYNAFKKAIEKLGGDVDGIGISTAGVIVDSKPMVSSIFIKTPKDQFELVKGVYINSVKRLEEELGHKIPFVVANDGDVTALAGANDLKEGGVLGLAFGTSEAGGYINVDRKLTGWFSELAFAPVDLQDNGPVDEWSHDVGVGCKYFSQDAVIRLAEKIGIKFAPEMTLAEKLKYVQKMVEDGDKNALNIFQTIGVYLGYAVAFYAEFYDLKHVLILGRVTSGKGGDMILKVSNEVLHSEFPEYKDLVIEMPSEYMRRVGQSIAATSLVDIGK